ncbi:hypothetical protein LPJ61_006585, partial [Coemansia biformis]
LGEYSDAKIVRSRDPAVLDTCDIVVDVGGVYDHDAKRYDHHQCGFDEQFSGSYKTKLSSAGLVYKHYGKEVIRAIAKDANLSDSEADLLHTKLYSQFIEGIDGIDNGLSQYPDEIDAAYRESTNLLARVGPLNPWWNQPESDMDERFAAAVALTGSEFRERIVEDAYVYRFGADSSGQIVLFEQYCPWKDHIDTIENEALEDPSLAKLIYVLYPDTSGAWRVQAVSEKPGSFVSRRALPEAWRGVRDDALSERSGIEGCIFVHQSGFIGGNKTRDGALALARKALTMD